MKTLARERDLAEILRRLRAVDGDSDRRWGRMSAHQMVCHLADAFRMALGQRLVRPASGLLQRTVVKAIALYVPLPWPAGRLPTSVELDQEGGGGTRPGDFDDDLAEVERLLGLVADSKQLGLQRHPTFGRMTEADWLRWGYLHTDHHLRQFGA